MEALTADLCETAWAEFQRIEGEGGVLASLQDGHIQRRVHEAASRRDAAYRAGERVIVGTTLYPQKTERPVETLAAEPPPAFNEGAAFCEPLFPVRIDQSIGAAP